MFGFFWDTLSARQRIIDETARRRAAATLIERLERDLMTCIVGDRAVGAGVKGDETSLRILTRSVPVRLAEQGASSGDAFCDLEFAEYRFDGPGGGILAGRTLARAGRTPRTDLFALGGEIHKVRFRYHDGDGWRETFDSLGADRLPGAIEVAIWYDAWPGEESDDGFASEGAEPIELPQRLTYDETAGFDEEAYAELSDMDLTDEPPPDRIRVIIVPDAATGGSESDEL